MDTECERYAYPRFLQFTQWHEHLRPEFGNAHVNATFVGMDDTGSTRRFCTRFSSFNSKLDFLGNDL